MKRFNFYKRLQFVLLPTFGIAWSYKDSPRFDYNYGLNFMWLNFLIVFRFGKKKYHFLGKSNLNEFYSDELLNVTVDNTKNILRRLWDK